MEKHLEYTQKRLTVREANKQGLLKSKEKNKYYQMMKLLEYF